MPRTTQHGSRPIPKPEIRDAELDFFSGYRPPLSFSSSLSFFVPAPAISILTPVLNAAPTLVEALDSARQQQPAPLEVLVQDGGSTDGSTSLWREFADVDGVCEPDGGLYEAMNRLLQRAKGEWVVFLQADDWLEPGALAAWARGVQQHPHASIITGGAQAVQSSPNGVWETVWSRETLVDKAFAPEILLLGEPMLNARLYRRTALLDLGGFSLRWRLASDRDLLLRLHAAGTVATTIPETVYRYRWHAASRTMNAGHASAQRLTFENIEIAETHLLSPSSNARKFLRQWHTQESVRLAMNALETRQWQSLGSAFLRGSRQDPRWILHLGAEFFRGAWGFLRRGGRTRSQLAREAK